MKTTLTVWPLVAAGLLACGVAQATRVPGMPPPKASQVYKAASANNVLSGVVTDIDPGGTRLQIDGKWFVVKRGRTQLLRGGLPVNMGTLNKGQQVQFSMASQSAGETALGVVYVP